jgi:hypothetical protein
VVQAVVGSSPIAHPSKPQVIANYQSYSVLGAINLLLTSGAEPSGQGREGRFRRPSPAAAGPSPPERAMSPSEARR